MDHVYFEGIVPRRALVAPVVRAPGELRLDARRAEAEALDPFVGWLFGQAGLDAERYRSRSLTRRLPACLRRLRAQTTEEAQRRVQERPELHLEALDVMLLGVTQFFRDPAVFACLHDEVLPALLPRARPVRIWSAACSEGQELYSVALLLRARGWLEECELLGTDLRASAIVRARAGVYAREPLDQLDPAQRRHFEPQARHVVMPAAVRDAIQWRREDLFRTAASGPWDLILWRNMAIYLAPPALEEVWRRIWRELRPGGYVVTGKAEQPPHGLGWTRVGPCVFKKREDPSA